MHWPLNHLTGKGRATLALAAGFLAFTASASEQADFSQPSGKTASSLAPVRPRDLENEYKIFDRPASKGSSSSVAMPPSTGPQQNATVIDAKTRARLLQEWDRKKNWLLNGSSKQVEPGQEKEEDPFEEVVNSRRTLLEKRFLADDSDGKKDRQKEIRRKHDQDNNGEDPSGAPDQFSDEKLQSSNTSRSGSEKGGSDKEASRAYFTDPFVRANVSKKSDRMFGSARREDDDKDKDKDKDATESQAAMAARSAARIGQIFSQPNAAAGPAGSSGLTGATEPLGQRNTHLDDLRNILGRDPNAVSSVAGVLGTFASSRPAAPAPAPVSTFSQPPAFIPAPVKRPELIMKPQPTILPRPTRDF
jgi:hypothetical protein